VGDVLTGKALRGIAEDLFGDQLGTLEDLDRQQVLVLRTDAYAEGRELAEPSGLTVTLPL
jgi:hypothetical protein